MQFTIIVKLSYMNILFFQNVHIVHYVSKDTTNDKPRNKGQILFFPNLNIGNSLILNLPKCVIIHAM